MVALLLSLLTAAPLALPDLEPPLGRIKDVIDVLPPGGVPGGEVVITYQPPGCEVPLMIRVSRFVEGMASAARQTQDWLGRSKGLEARVFGKKRLGALLEPVAALSFAQSAPRQQCAAAAPTDGYRLTLEKAPAKLCAAPKGQGLGEHWFLGKNGKPVAVVLVSQAEAGATQKCTARLSGLLFDKTGTSRFALHAPWGGAASASILGAPSLDFTFDDAQQVFKVTERFPSGRTVR